MAAPSLEFRALHEWVSINPIGYTELASWVQGYLCEPHEELGRPGPVCPYVQKALTQNLIDIAFVPREVTTVEAITELVQSQADAFIAAYGWCTKQQPAAIMVFAHFNYEQCQDVLLSAHRAAKPAVVQRGLMLGEFFPGHDFPGLRNKSFRAGEAPCPMLVIRRMVRQDEAFLHGGPPGVYESYLKRFGEPYEAQAS